MRGKPKAKTIDEYLAALSDDKRAALAASPPGADAPIYRSAPPARDEFSTDEEPLAWDAEGWEDVG